MQAQYNPSPFLAVLARLDGFSPVEFRTALDSHRVVKASLMRGTLHVVGAAEYQMYASAVDGPVTRLWNTWLGKLLDVEPMQAALLALATQVRAAMTRWSPSARTGRASTSRRRRSGRRSAVGSSPGATRGCCVRRTRPGWKRTDATGTSPPDRCAPDGRHRPEKGLW
ncbi:MAG: winged helix DNA-binding domain-containing protein [Geodermatophilaceae bacterium]|nr:winged helix DNA-binding domain-containing protein [Geodermatophilaceae bacterium]